MNKRINEEITKEIKQFIKELENKYSQKEFEMCSSFVSNKAFVISIGISDKENELNKIFKSKEFKTIETDTITNDDILKVYNYCINLIDELKKDIDKPTIEDIKNFMNNKSNKEEYILSEYESNYTYIDFIIDTLDSNIRFL